VFSKINISQILKDHFKTLRNQETNRISGGDIFTFIALPIIVSLIILYVIGFILDKDASSILITSLSVFSALLFNLLLLIYDIVKREERVSNTKDSPLTAKLLREIYSNISFSILISVICVSVLLITLLNIKAIWFNQIISFFVYYLVIQFLLTIFMVLKRVHVLLSQEIKEQTIK
jgi:hypothetical protein